MSTVAEQHSKQKEVAAKRKVVSEELVSRVGEDPGKERARVRNYEKAKDNAPNLKSTDSGDYARAMQPYLGQADLRGAVDAQPSTKHGELAKFNSQGHAQLAGEHATLAAHAARKGDKQTAETHGELAKVFSKGEPEVAAHHAKLAVREARQK